MYKFEGKEGNMSSSNKISKVYNFKDLGSAFVKLIIFLVFMSIIYQSIKTGSIETGFINVMKMLHSVIVAIFIIKTVQVIIKAVSKYKSRY